MDMQMHDTECPYGYPCGARQAPILNHAGADGGKPNHRREVTQWNRQNHHNHLASTLHHLVWHGGMAWWNTVVAEV